MLTLKTKVLLFLAAVCGVGIGILAPLSDGLYSAVLLFLFPFVVAAMALAIGMDLSKAPVVKIKPPVRVRPRLAVAKQLPVLTSQSVH